MKSIDMNRGLRILRELFLGTLLIVFVNLAVSWVFITPVRGQPINGKILRQELDASGNGYTVMKVWGTYYEMGYAHGYLLGEQIDKMVQSLKLYVGSSYNDIKSEISNTYYPPDMRDEIDGMVAGIQEVVQDIMMLNTIGDWEYSPNCRSHSSWGAYVNPPVKTLSTRRLDYQSTPEYFDFLNVLLCAYEPSDTSKVRWVNLFSPGG